ncbi:type IIL restriction-modification enzyme MmeI [Amycolatopsis sulphurea]|uniref:type IIL restriction-modification enzyme MmeI n=1 Tax=Amycolatopsis sulphurea TaxID=76022 RepID=UPI000BF49F68|nr:type IIL restriction-modification enzyme MmeI [Amycolatopsis sulphurea]
MVATNTVAQGDTREVGLDAMVADGFTITRAIQSRSWPASSANLEYAAAWGTLSPVADNVPRVADDIEVRRISTLLEPTGRAEGNPARLLENTGVAHIGSLVLGMGFTITPEVAAEWISLDSRNGDVLFPFLNGENLNQRPDASAARWIVDFGQRSLEAARAYPTPFEHVVLNVKPERTKNPRKPYRDRWWQFAEKQMSMRKAIAELREVLVIALVSKTVMPMRVPSGHVFSHTLGVFATKSFADQAVLSSSVHQLWAIKYGSGMRNDPRYTPSDVFETFPRPAPFDPLEIMGRALDVERREIMLRRDLGLTKIYNLVNDPVVQRDTDIDRLREIHVELDREVLAAYGWSDIYQAHGFHSYRQMARWSVSPAARAEILDRLLEENQRRANENKKVGRASASKVGIPREEGTLFT